MKLPQFIHNILQIKPVAEIKDSKEMLEYNKDTLAYNKDVLKYNKDVLEYNKSRESNFRSLVAENLLIEKTDNKGKNEV